jgi:ribonuclease D
MDLPLKSPIWIDRPSDLGKLVDVLLCKEVIAVDTESNSLYAYREQVCMVQFSTESDDYLVDPLAIRDLSMMAPLFANPSIEKVFHAAEYDLICLKRDYGFEFAGLFDTMMASRILGRSGLGLGTLLEQEFGVLVDKRLQRANWARRPLSPEMLAYARMDTHFLVALRNILKEELIRSDRLALAEEDFLRLTRVHAGVHDNGEGTCWKISGVQDLTPRQAAVLMELCAFREERARASNQPPFRILQNQTLLELAQRMPRKRAELNQVFGLSPKLIERYGSGLLAAVERGIVGPPAYRPLHQRLSDAILWRLDLMRNWRKMAAREMGVESDVVLPRDVLETIADRNPRSVEELQAIMIDYPWRLNHFGQQILQALNH